VRSDGLCVLYTIHDLGIFLTPILTPLCSPRKNRRPHPPTDARPARTDEKALRRGAFRFSWADQEGVRWEEKNAKGQGWVR